MGMGRPPRCPHQGVLLAHEAVEQRRLADVGAADEGHLGCDGVGGRAGWRWRQPSAVAIVICYCLYHARSGGLVLNNRKAAAAAGKAAKRRRTVGKSASSSLSAALGAFVNRALRA